MTRAALELLAPLSGAVVALDNVPDPVFRQKLVGDGIAVEPTSTTLLAPCAGRVLYLHPCHHALTLETSHGLQILLHIGIDTVQLKGEGFRPRVQTGAKVKSGEPLIDFDADLIARQGKSLITLMIATGEAVVKNLGRSGTVSAGTPLLQVQSRGSSSAPTTETIREYAEAEEFQVRLPTGLHARPAALLAGMAKAHACHVELISATSVANAKSVVAIMSLAVADGERLRFFAEGPGAKMAVAELTAFLRDLREAEPSAPPPVATRAAAKISHDPNLLAGVAVSPGLALGRVRQWRATTVSVPERAVGSPASEREALLRAVKQAGRELEALRLGMKSPSAGGQAAIFAAHQELLQDPDILTLAETHIAEGKSAGYAWNQAINTHAERLAGLRNELMANRATDLRDVGQRVLRVLNPTPGIELDTLPPETILIAETLTPSQTVQIDREKVLAFCTVEGGPTSHVAILARSLGLPALAGVDRSILQIADGSEVILDGDNGEIRLNPSATLKAEILERQQRQRERHQVAAHHAAEPARTRDGKTIEVSANIGSPADAREAVKLGADGVGLLRSEFLFLQRDQAPSEDEQLAIYQQIADTLGPRPLVIRTLDVGGDKPLHYLPLEKEDNPFLGIRGIRIGLEHPEILRTQLRAILRVKTQGRLHVMFPMIATLEEWRQARAILEEERRALGVPPIAAGIMVEVPSAALIAEAFACEVDFFSIGTNDLTQYTLAMDRGHKALAKQADALHPSVLILIERTCQAAAKHGRWVGVCGGLAGDAKAVPILLGLGVTELSVSLPALPLIKAQVRECNLSSARQLALRALAASSPQEIREMENFKQGASLHGPAQDGVLVSPENR